MAKDAVATLKELVAHAENALTDAQLASAIVNEMGGIDFLAKEWVGAYKATKAGSVARTRMLESAFKLLERVAPKGAGGDLSHLDEEGLQKLLKTMVEKAGILGQPGPAAVENATDTDRPEF